MDQCWRTMEPSAWPGCVVLGDLTTGRQPPVLYADVQHCRSPEVVTALTGPCRRSCHFTTRRQRSYRGRAGQS